jgi:preflagellin peptidase FlaK
MDYLLAMLDWYTVNTLNILRVAVCILILGYSCVTDWKTRRAPNRLWYFMGAIGLILGGFELYHADYNRYGLLLSWALSFTFIFVIMYFLYYFFQRFGMSGLGGADAKALIAIAIIFPYYPQVYALNWSLPVADISRSIIFGLAVFGNALVLNLILPVGLLAYNLLNVPVRELISGPLIAFTGYKSDVEGLKGKHVRLMHRYTEEDGRLEKSRAFGGSEVDDTTYQNLLRWKSEGRIGDKVWVTPKIPFLIPITMGFLTAIVYGDILTQAIGLLLVR